MSGDEITVSRLAWDLHRSTDTGLVERIYELNPGLGRRGIQLPLGTRISVDVAPRIKAPTREIIRLWD